MYKAWGKSVAIDLLDCPHEMIDNKDTVLDFIQKVIKYIDMKAHGPTYIERFGEIGKHPGPGYSAMQFIETSSITIHCDEFDNRVFIDIFSCKDFDADAAAQFSKEYFKAKEIKYTPLER